MTTSMTDQKILVLAAKDALVQDQQFNLLHWSEAKWLTYVMKFVGEIKQLSPGRQSEIRMRYKQ